MKSLFDFKTPKRLPIIKVSITMTVEEFRAEMAYHARGQIACPPTMMELQKLKAQVTCQINKMTLSELVAYNDLHGILCLE